MAEKTALVLSAGGLFGAYQAGAWIELAGRFQPDMIVAASVGALNGWAIAGGCKPDELTEHWRGSAAGGFLKWREKSNMWRGFFDAASFRAEVGRLTAAYKPQIRLGIVLADILRRRSRIVETPAITATHLTAACAIPFGFPPVRIDGRWYVDGGLLGALPLWAAAEMGATRAIAINALPQLPSRVLRGLVHVVQWCSPERHGFGTMEVATIAPSEPLGSLADSTRWERSRIERWIELGAKDARSITISSLCPSIGSTE
ncbi:MAG TPA: patatin-like phospholipase family protein [Bryobacteraceae bacterium]|nr:patatin-like phospholipase family protein [Bryobacteraceae bacterium]